jgi:NADH-quinone oxidoreductase subunit N
MFMYNWEQDLLLASPMLVLTFGALLILMLEVFIKEAWPRAGVAATTLLAGLVAAYYNWDLASPGQKIFYKLIYADPYTVFLTFIIIVSAALVLVLAGDYTDAEGIESPSEYYSLMLMSTVGAIIFVSAAEMITLFIGLEVMSMALYCLCGSALGSRRSAESALKYFFLGSFSSAFLLYGIVLLYGMTGSTEFSVIAAELGDVSTPLLFVAVSLIALGFLFKIGAAPLHFWTPDVYQGAPTGVTAYMACVIKAAAFGAALRVFWIVFGDAGLHSYWTAIVWYVAMFTMIIGNFIALRQRSVKRLLAYSSIGHAGYMLVAFLALDPQYGGGAAVLYYLIAYSVMTIGAFGVVLVIGSGSGQDSDSDDLSRFRSLSKREPVLAGLMALFLLSMAGLPPGMSGLLGKFYVFSAAISAGYTGLVIVGVLCSAVSCYYYLRVIVEMYFLPSEEVAPVAGPISLSMSTSLKLCGVLVVLLGVFPSLIYSTTSQIMMYLQ